MLIGCFALFFVLVFVCLTAGWSLSWALLGGLILFWLRGMRQGFTPGQLWHMAWEKCKRFLLVVKIMLMIGIITGLWRCSGTIAGCIVWGVGLVTPRLFVLIAFLLCAALSYLLGTSFGVCSTMGVILMALARSGGVDTAVVAGAVISGAYFGDRCSPASSAASLVAAVTGTDLYTNVRQMLRTGLIPTCMTMGVYLSLSLANPMEQMDESVLLSLQNNFHIGWPVLLPAVVMFLLPLLKVPIKAAMAASIAVAAVVAVAVQGFTLPQLLLTAWSGYHPADSALEAVLGGGGLTSMTASYVLVPITGLYAGVLDGTGALKPLEGKVDRLVQRLGRFPAMAAVTALVASTLCNQSVATMMGQQLLGGFYDSDEELAIDIENSSVLISGLVPWSIACSIPLSMLGVGNGAIVYAVLLWITPICYGFTKRWYYPGDSVKQQGVHGL